MSAILFLHICSGTLGLLSGAAAMTFRKGSRRHGIAGNVFVISMLGLGASGAYMGWMKHQTVNVAMGLLTCYLVATAWRTARRDDSETSFFDLGALMVPLGVAGAFLGSGLQALNSQNGLKDGMPAAPYFIIGLMALLFAIGDIHMLVRRNLSSRQRLARHLCRMCVALFIASGSLFLARPHLFPSILRRTGILFVLGILPLILMIFWIFRARFANAYKRRSMPHGGHAVPVRS